MDHFFHSAWLLYLDLCQHKIAKRRQQRKNSVVLHLDFSGLSAKPTASSMALYYFVTIFLQQTQLRSFQSQQMGNLHRNHFGGGMVQVVRHIPLPGARIRQVDANSMYCSQMFLMPIYPVRPFRNDLKREDVYQMVQQQVFEDPPGLFEEEEDQDMDVFDQQWEQIQLADDVTQNGDDQQFDHQVLPALSPQSYNNHSPFVEIADQNFQVQSFLVSVLCSHSVSRWLFTQDQIQNLSHCLRFEIKEHLSNFVSDSVLQRLASNSVTVKYFLKQVTFPPNIVPFIGVHGKKLMYPGFLDQAFVNGKTFARLIASRCSFIIVSKVQYSNYRLTQKEDCFWDYATTMYQKRMEYKGKKEMSGLQGVAKLSLNGLAGKLIQKPTYHVQVLDEAQYYQESVSSADFVFYQHDGTYIKKSRRSRSSPSGRLHRLGGWVTQCARADSNRMMSAIGAAKILYGDTDSWLFDDRDVILPAELIGPAFGQWKVQNPKQPFTSGFFLSRKCYVIMSDTFPDGTPISQIRNQAMHQMYNNRKACYSRFSINQWLCALTCKIRMKGINAKLTRQQATRFVDHCMRTWEVAVLRGWIGDGTGCTISKLPIEGTFQTQNWSRKRNVGVVVVSSMPKQVSMTFNRCPLADGSTRSYM